MKTQNSNLEVNNDQDVMLAERLLNQHKESLKTCRHNTERSVRYSIRIIKILKYNLKNYKS